jgi:hypothetical protein
MATPKTVIEIVDVDGSFRRFIRESPKEARKELGAAVKKSLFMLAKRMEALAPDRSPEAPHIKDAITSESRGMSGRAGVLDAEASQPAAPGSSWTQADVALFNEYSPNRQAFMRPAAEAIDSDLKRECTRALQRVERTLGSGVGI